MNPIKVNFTVKRDPLDKWPIELGLDILAALREPRRCYTLNEIAAYAGVTKERIRQIEEQALKKLMLRARRHGLSREVLAVFSKPESSGAIKTQTH